jgi:hypothetical protein
MASPSFLWRVYYDHWAVDANLLKKKEFISKCAIKSIKTIWCWFAMSNIDHADIDFKDCSTDLVASLGIVLPTLLPIVKEEEKVYYKMKLLQEMAEMLAPRHTPDDSSLFPSDILAFEIRNGQVDRGLYTPNFYISPAEYRLKKNLNLPSYNDFSTEEMGDRLNDLNFMELEMTADQVRRIDSIVALM